MYMYVLTTVMVVKCIFVIINILVCRFSEDVHVSIKSSQWISTTERSL